MQENEKHLRRLSNLSFALATFTLLIPLALVWTNGRAPAWLSVAFVGLVFLFMLVMMGVWLSMALVAPAVLGWQLRTRRRYDLSLTAAALTCGYLPFGTLLGGWTLLTLSRESVRALFADRTSVPISEDGILYLNLLSRFHYVVSLINGVFCFYLLVFELGIALSLGQSRQEKNPVQVESLLGVAAVIGVLFVWLAAVCVCTWLAGRYVKQRRHRLFCLLVAAVNCITFPQTILGVFSILVLSRPSVRLLFESPHTTPTAGLNVDTHPPQDISQ
jgi:hypothetical protein